MTLVKFTNDPEQLWYRISKDDIVESFENDSLKVVSNDIMNKYNIEEHDSKNKFERIYELIINGEGYNYNVEDYIENCEDIEDAKNEAEKKIKDGYIWFASVNDWKKFDIEDIKLVEKYIEKDEDLAEEFEDDLNNCDYAETFTEDYIRVDSINEKNIYFDDYTDEFFLGENVLDWEKNKYYWCHDGSNWRMKEICEIKEVEAEHIGYENYEAGCLETYELKNGKEFVIDNSMYQGSIDNVLEEYTEII